MSAPQLLLVSPAFHGYYDALRQAFDAVGFHTSVVTYDAFSTAPAKAWNKLRFELPERLGLDTSNAFAAYLSRPALRALRSLRPDFVIVIKGDALCDEWWDELAASQVPYVVWIYDEMRRMTFSEQRLRSFEKVATYSAQDYQQLAATGVHTMHIANGFDTFMPYREIGDRSEVTFVGAAYENRKEVMTAIRDSGHKVRVYGRDWSHDLRDRARTWNRPRPNLPASRDVSRADAYGVMQGSLANINVHHNQDGFTMRTFEIPGVGGLQLIDRPDVLQHYEPGTEVLVYDGMDDLVETLDRVRRDTAWVNSIREAGKKRTFAEHTMVHRARQMKQFLHDA